MWKNFLEKNSFHPKCGESFQFSRKSEIADSFNARCIAKTKTTRERFDISYFIFMFMLVWKGLIYALPLVAWFKICLICEDLGTFSEKNGIMWEKFPSGGSPGRYNLTIQSMIEFHSKMIQFNFWFKRKLLKMIQFNFWFKRKLSKMIQFNFQFKRKLLGFNSKKLFNQKKTPGFN